MGSASRRLVVVSLVGCGLLVGPSLAGCGKGHTTDDAGPGMVDASMPVDAGPMMVDSGPIPPPCPIEGALSLPMDEVSGRVSGMSANPSTTCTPHSGAGGPEHLYSLHVDEHTGVRLTATSTAETVLAVRTACDDPLSELACSSPEALRLPGADTVVNTILEPGDYFVLVDVYAFGVGGDYTVALETFDAAPNGTCASATPVVDGTVLMGESTEGAGTATVVCDGVPPSEGELLWYSITMPTLTRLTVLGTGLFDLHVSIRPTPYTETTLSTSCDDMSAGTVVPGPTSDDSTSAPLALPFAFDFFGDAVTHYSVSSNGIAQLWPSSRAAGSADYNNIPLPSPGAPLGLVAPLWDDLVPGMGASVRTLVSGTGSSRRLTVEWSNWMYISDGRGALLTFQAKLFETTGVIEFHYCSMGTADPEYHAGASATVGLQNLTGTDGVLHSFDTPASVSVTTALRFTPAP